jgi:hypothetical protein
MSRFMGCTETSLEPGYRSDIRDCTDKSCALFDFRPYQAKGGQS